MHWYPELAILKELSRLIVLGNSSYFPEREKLAALSDLSALARIRGLENLDKLKVLLNLYSKGERETAMGDLFGQYTRVPDEYEKSNLEAITQYEEHYMMLIRNYKGEIQAIEAMMQELRKERQTFYKSTLPEIETQIREDEVLSEDAKRLWIQELRTNVENSFRISEDLISHYVTSNLEEFKRKLMEAIDKV